MKGLLVLHHPLWEVSPVPALPGQPRELARAPRLRARCKRWRSPDTSRPALSGGATPVSLPDSEPDPVGHGTDLLPLLPSLRRAVNITSCPVGVKRIVGQTSPIQG